MNSGSVNVVMELADRHQISDDGHAAYDARASVRPSSVRSAVNQWLIRPIGSCTPSAWAVRAIPVRVASTPGTGQP